MSLTKRASLLLMAGFYVLAGVQHFRDPEFYLQIMPANLPWHLELVYLSGVAEIVLGVALLVPRLRRYAAFGVIALLIAVFPANLSMWWNDVQIGGRPTPPWFHAVRLPLQGVFVLWAWWHTRPDDSRGAAGGDEGREERRARRAR